ncbi:MAG: hypothetical protein II767_10310 [Proteobacteria bacterium]|nr:hypothetical protein [Pseudomonadota bacterium]
MYDDKKNNDFGQNQDTSEWDSSTQHNSDFNQANIASNNKPKYTPLRTTVFEKIYNGEIRGKYVIYLSIFGVVFVVFVILFVMVSVHLEHEYQYYKGEQLRKQTEELARYQTSPEYMQEIQDKWRQQATTVTKDRPPQELQAQQSKDEEQHAIYEQIFRDRAKYMSEDPVRRNCHPSSGLIEVELLRKPDGTVLVSIPEYTLGEEVAKCAKETIEKLDFSNTVPENAKSLSVKYELSF